MVSMKALPILGKIREDIASCWLTTTDEAIARRWGVSRVYVAKNRRRMGLIKTIERINEVRLLNPQKKKQRASTGQLEAIDDEEAARIAEEAAVARMRSEYDDPHGVL